MLSTTRATLLLWTLSAAALAGVLVIAQLEKDGSPVGVPLVDPLLSPNGDSTLESIEIQLNPPHPTRVSVRVVDKNEQTVSVVARKIAIPKGRKTLSWNGRRSDGVIAPDGTYRLKITDHPSGRTLIVPTSITLDTQSPTLGEPTADLSRVDTLRIVRVQIPVKDAAEIWLELDGERLVTNRIRPRRADLEGGKRTKVKISARLPQSEDRKSLAGGSSDRLTFIAVDRAGNRSETDVVTDDASNQS